MSPDELLDRIATTLRNDIGPAVVGDYPKTQAFMAAVVIERIARGLRAAEADERASRSELADLTADLDRMDVLRAAAVRIALADAAASTAGADGRAGLSALVIALYDCRSELGETAFAAALDRVRQTLRSQIDRRAEVAR